MTENNNEFTVDRAFGSLVETMNGVMPWMAQLYNKEQGGFHCAHSSLQDPKTFFCSLWDTYLALVTLYKGGLLDTMPQEMRKKLIAYFQSRQDSRDGYFYDTVRFTDKRFTSRVTGASKAALTYLGAEPLYPMPGDGQITFMFEELGSVEKFRSWLQGLDWSNAYNSGSQISDRKAMINMLSEPLRSDILITLWEFLHGIQSDVTGFWGCNPEELSFNYTSGVMKLTQTYKYFNVPLPKADQICKSAYEVLKNKTSNFILDYRNIATAFRNVGEMMPDKCCEEDTTHIICLIGLELRRFLHGDGGFSRFTDRPYYGEENLILSGGLREGDMNSTMNVANGLRGDLYAFAGLECPKLPGSHGFYKMIYPY